MDSLLVRPFDPITSRQCHRLTNVFATTLETDDLLGAAGHLPSAFLRLGRMQRFYDACSHQLPRVAGRADLPPEAVTLRRGDHRDYTIKGASSWLFDVPAAPVVLAITVDVECQMLDLIPLMEDLYYCEIEVDGNTPTDLARLLVAGQDDLSRAAKELSEVELEPEIHQIIHLGVGSASRLPSHDTLQRLIYRADLDCTEEYSAVSYPTELNRRPTSLAALGPYASVLVAQQDYIENGCFLSAVQLVAAASKVRRIREATRGSLVELTTLDQNRNGAERRGIDIRAQLARSAESLANQELQLTFGVESSRALNMLIPSMRLDSYHRSLAVALGLDDSVKVVSDMLSRLRAVIDAEANSLKSYFGRREELRRLRWGAIIGLLSAVAVPVGIVLSFFGGQSAQVHPHTSLFDLRLYLDLYAFLLVVLGISAFIFIGLWWREKRELRRLRSR